MASPDPWARLAALPIAQAALGAALVCTIGPGGSEQAATAIAAAARSAAQGAACAGASRGDGDGSGRSDDGAELVVEALDGMQCIFAELGVKGVTQAKEWLRGAGRPDLASRVGKVSKSRNGVAHRDVKLQSEIKEAMGSMEQMRAAETSKNASVPDAPSTSCHPFGLEVFAAGPNEQLGHLRDPCVEARAELLDVQFDCSQALASANALADELADGLMEARAAAWEAKRATEGAAAKGRGRERCGGPPTALGRGDPHDTFEEAQAVRRWADDIDEGTGLAIDLQQDAPPETLASDRGVEEAATIDAARDAAPPETLSSDGGDEVVPTIDAAPPETLSSDGGDEVVPTIDRAAAPPETLSSAGSDKVATAVDTMTAAAAASSDEVAAAIDSKNLFDGVVERKEAALEEAREAMLLEDEWREALRHAREKKHKKGRGRRGPSAYAKEGSCGVPS
ncbi:unnamed protein product [Prorocentrum cordatum]|uniref:Uncharacterized protein n=1 Tax=Prorocentrum cordatum TaxID=2364126 RepID=A0ABN9YB27_9DINO|nr:unnamed protein product [Polarella glacialis]